MSAGRPVRKREQGFANDIAALNRLKTALKIDASLPDNEVALAIRDCDSLIERLADLHKKQERKAAKLVANG